MQSVKRLLAQFIPHSYQVTVDITKRVERTFSGSVVIKGNVPANADEVILHSHDLTITKALVNGKAVTTKAGKDDELALQANVTAGDHTLELHFSGKITDRMQGLYPCYFTLNGEPKELLMTQLESHSARELFPCVDEPAAKAVFNLTLLSEPNITTLANTPVATQKTEASIMTTTFQPTPKMSTYLLAFVTGDLAYTETTNQHGVTVRAYATPDKVQQTKFALQLAAKTLDFYDEYFAVPYPLPKCDLVAVPDFAAGAMENWGLVTFRESCMLVDPANTAADTKEWIAEVVTHELSHQWFGNLVTMKWWDDLWLNESFARWAEHFTVDHFYPEWQAWEQFGAGDQQAALNRDGLANVQAVRQPVHHPDELHTLFDPAIVYAKGACLMRMLHDYLGATVYRDGLRIYMQRHQYGNAEASDLWAALGEAAGKDVGAFMQPWITQPGHPVVNVTINGDDVTLSQSRFYNNPDQTKNHNAIWPLPLLSAQFDEPLLTAATQTLPAKSQPVMLNKDHTGFYHMHYQSDQLAAIAKQVAAGAISTVDRQGLLVDNLALTRAGITSMIDVLRLLASYRHEASFPVWEAIASVVGSARLIIDDEQPNKGLMQKFVQKLAQEQFERLGGERIAGESYFDELLRPTIISFMAYAEVPAVISHILQLFDHATAPNDILPEIRSIVFAVAVRQRGEPAFDRLLQWYKTTTSADERVNLCAGMTSMRTEPLAKKAIALFGTKTIKPQDFVYWFIYMLRNRHSRNLAWQWMEDNWADIQKQYGGTHDYADFPKYSASALRKRDELERYKQFFTPKLNEQEIALTIQQGIEDITARVLWRERDLPGVTEFLQQY